jgi:outer membrane protein OmpA-like peptidoglycan-associated protein
MLAFVVGGLLLGLGFLLGGGHPAAVHDVVLIDEKTTRAPGMLAEEVRQRVLAIARTGDGGQLAVHAVGARDFALRPVDLAVMRDNELENDPSRRETVIGHRLAALSSELDAAPVGSEGFNLVAALQVAASASSNTGRRAEVWLQTTLLSSSSDPLRMTDLTAAEPEQAVKEVIRSTKIGTLDLSRVDLHPVLLAPVGDNQAPLTPWDNAWRTAFITDLGSALGATVSPPVLVESSGPAWSAASTVPPIPAHEERTPYFPPAPGGEPPVVIDTAGFVPDTATLLDMKATQGEVAGLVSRYEQANGKYTIEVKGFTAAFGDAESSRVLSRERAAVLGNLLALAGIPRSDLHTVGVGFDERADPTQHPKSAAQRVVVVRLLPRGT